MIPALTESICLHGTLTIGQYNGDIEVHGAI